MAVPKKKTSVSRKGMRNTHRKTVAVINLGECNQCGTYKVPHHICSCGYYNNRLILKKRNKVEEE